MFNMGFAELALIFVVALIVFGPQRLPKIARQLGQLLAQGKKMWQQAQNEVDNEQHH